MKTVLERFYVGLQYILPKRLLSGFAGHITRSENRLVKSSLIAVVRKMYNIDLDEAAVTDPERYRSFNAFFTRSLRVDARPLPTDSGVVVSPVDGALSQAGQLRQDAVLQAKGQEYSVSNLLGRIPEASDFNNGHFATIYLAPHNYHRVHMPVDGLLNRVVRIPGALFSVNEVSMRRIPGLLVRNERVVTLFDRPAGRVAVVLVGAMMVGSITLALPDHDDARVSDRVSLAQGDELGRFNMGSTVVVLFSPGSVEWDKNLAPGLQMRMGQRIGRDLRPTSVTGGPTP